MTQELTKEYLQDLGFIKVYNWFGTWHIYRYWYKTDGKTKELQGIICNLSDYSLGSTKGGQITHLN